MERAVKECGSTDIGVIVENYRTRRFKFASKNFYASFVAACRTAGDYEKYYGPVTLEPPFRYHEHVLDKYYRPTVLAKALGLSFEDLQDYNLAVRPSVFKNDQHLPKGYHLKLPESFAWVNVDSMIGAIPDQFVRDTLPAAAYHKVSSGENLWIISQRYGISLNTLFRLNNLDQNACIYPGQMIALPGGKALPPAEVTVATADKSPAKTSSTAPAEPARKASGAGILPGYLYAKPRPEPPLSVVEAVSADNLWAFMVPAMTALTLFGVRECEFCEFNADHYHMEFVEQTDDEVTLVVQINETLGHYADWMGSVSSRIRALNNISARISMGQKVRVPVPRGKSADFLRKRIEHHMGIEEDFFNNFEVAAMDTIQMKPGVTLWSICRDNDIPFWLFMKANHLGPDLKVGPKDKILLPVIEDKSL
jgi:membrane-bound lytic murein transglycosylase D